MRKSGTVVLTLALVFGGGAVANQRIATRMVECWNAYHPVIVSVSNRYQVPPSLALSVAYWESGCDPTARRYEPGVALWPSVRRVVDKGERDFQATSFGLFQVLGVTARGMGFQGMPAEFQKPEVNAEYGIRYLAGRYREWGNWPDALASYNGGRGAILRKRRTGTYGAPEGYVRGVLALQRFYAVPIVRKWLEIQNEEGV